jgi:hypothetical protein
MDIRFNCPRCRQHFTVDESVAGMRVNCPRCEGQITIPRDTAPQAPIDEGIDTQPAAIAADKAEKRPVQKERRRHNWRDDPASESQKECLQSSGIPIREGLTKGQASDLLSGGALQIQERIRKAERRVREANYQEQRRIKAQYPSYYLKGAIASALKELEETKKERRNAHALVAKKSKKLAAAQQKKASATDEFDKMQLDGEIRDIEQELGEAEVALDDISVEEAKDELKYQSGLRIKFWRATFPSGARSFTMEDWEGLADYDEVIERYSDLGRRFKVPRNQQISDTLVALDRDAPDWDKTEPERFYSALAANFPDLLKKARGFQRIGRPGAGCLVVIGTVTAIFYLLWRFA